ncbi:uncharacterized protein BROUX77_002290 [Berkeleyomyces rouxiae]|uniref:uncharacterized protein n=1 Tax=Berkeleyomyces rouxiae TaxID=2035830 RepID=UPI003B81EDFF
MRAISTGQLRRGDASSLPRHAELWRTKTCRMPDIVRPGTAIARAPAAGKLVLLAVRLMKLGTIRQFAHIAPRQCHDAGS